MKSSRFLFSILTALVLVAGLFAALPANNVSAATLCVNTDGSDGCYTSIQAAITAASAGDTITVAAGTYNEIGQIVINKDLSIVGAGAGTTIIKPTSNTGSVDDARGWFLVGTQAAPNVVFNLSGVTLDGAGYNIYTAIRSWGTGTIEENVITNIRYSKYVGIGIYLFGTTLVQNNTFTNIERIGMYANGLIGPTNAVFLQNTYTGKGDGDWLDYGVEVERGAQVTIQGNTITNCTGIAASDGSGSAAVLVTTYFGGGTTANLIDNTITNNTVGIAIGYDVSDAAVVTATGNTFTDNEYPVSAQNAGNINLENFLADNTIDKAVSIDGDYVLYSSIQEAIDDATAGDTIHVAAGTYNEDLDIGKSITLLGPNETISPNTGTRLGEAVIAPLDQAGVADPAILATAGNINVTIKGFTFDMVNTADQSDRFVESINKTGINWVFEHNIFTNAPETINGNWYITGTTNPMNLVLLDNYFHHNGVSNGISLWGDGHTVDIRDNVWKDNAGWAVNFNFVTGTFSGNQVLDTEEEGPNWYDEQAGFLFASTNNLTLTNNLMDGLPNPYIRLYDSFTGTLTMTGNTFSNSEDPAMGIIRISAGANLSGLRAEQNSFLNDPLVFQNMDDQALDGSPNWYGTILGPSASQISGPAITDPWCGDAACSFLVSATPVENGFYVQDGQLVLAGTIHLTGGFVINEPHLTILLRDGTVIQNNSPCFIVNASYTTITTESIGGAKCIPTNGSNGIDVAADLVNIVIEGIEFDGTGQTTGSGIAFAGAISDVQVVDNWFHDLDGSGITFAGTVGGTHDIQGNLFQNVGVNDISSSVPINAQYNSWNGYAGKTIPNIDTDPWTYADLWIGSSGTPWLNQVVRGGTITYTVYGTLQNVMGAAFSLNFPTELTVNSTSLGTVFGNQMPLEVNAGRITFTGFELDGTPVTGSNLPLFTVTFSAPTAGSFLIYPDSTSDTFSMAPGYGPSTNVYASVLMGSTVRVIDLPTLSSTLTDTYVIGEPNEFTVTITNPTTGAEFTDPALAFSLPTGSILEYWNGTSWQAVTGAFTPAAISPDGIPVNLTFRVTLVVGPGTYPLTVDLYDSTTDPDTLLATTTGTATLGYLPTAVTGTVSMQGRTYRGDVPMILTATTWTTYGPYTAYSTNVISSNISFTNIVADTYILTTNQPRYLDITAAMNKTINVSSDTVIAALELKGGDANDDNEVSSADAGIVGGQYGTVGTNGDLNFSGKVDIFDLALLGGNYTLTSQTAYSTWLP